MTNPARKRSGSIRHERSITFAYPAVAGIVFPTQGDTALAR
jgi:hypothetical protein